MISYAISVHGFLPTARSLPDAVFTVLQDLRTLSSSTTSSPRKTFLTGTSMGGLTVLYALTTADRFTEEERGKMPPVHGAFAMCPLLDGEFAYVQRLT
jgi:alpha-beta hydrolase superfamily lysophospholipase